MSTVGYGDVYPITPTGQVVGTVVSFLSMIFLAMPLTIIVSSFSKTYKDSKKGNFTNDILDCCISKAASLWFNAGINVVLSCGLMPVSMWCLAV